MTAARTAVREPRPVPPAAGTAARAATTVTADTPVAHKERSNVGGRRYGASMAKSVTRYRCTECGWQTPKWNGRCGECQAWGTVEEIAPSRLVRAGIRAAGYGSASGGRQRGPGTLGGGPVSTP